MIKTVHYVIKIKAKDYTEFMKLFEKYRKKLPKDTETIINP